MHTPLGHCGSETNWSVGCVITLDRPRFPFNDMEISMVDICILDVLITSILELFHYKHGYLRLASDLTVASVSVYSSKNRNLVCLKEFHWRRLGLNPGLLPSKSSTLPSEISMVA